MNKKLILLSLIESLKGSAKKFDLLRKYFPGSVFRPGWDRPITYKSEFGEFKIPDTISQWKGIISFKIDRLHAEDLDRFHIDQTIQGLMYYFKIRIPEIYYDLNSVVVYEIDGMTLAEMRITVARDLRDVGLSKDDSWIFDDDRVGIFFSDNSVDLVFSDPRPFNYRLNREMMALFNRCVKRLRSRFSNLVEIAESKNFLLQQAIFELADQRRKEVKDIARKVKLLIRALSIEIDNERLSRLAGKAFIGRIQAKKIDLTDYFTDIARSRNLDSPKFMDDLVDLVMKSELKQSIRREVISCIKSGELSIISLIKDNKLDKNVIAQAEIELIKNKTTPTDV